MLQAVEKPIDERPSFEDCREFWEFHFSKTLPANYQDRDLEHLDESDEKRVLKAS